MDDADEDDVGTADSAITAVVAAAVVTTLLVGISTSSSSRCPVAKSAT